MKIYRGYKIRLLPTEEQEQLLWKHVHACRFLWNYMIEYQEQNYKNGEKYLSNYNMMKVLTSLKKKEEYLWLGGVSTTSLQRVCTDVDIAYKAFFKALKGHPRFKDRKKSKKSYPISLVDSYFTDNNTYQVPKVGKIKYSCKCLPIGKRVDPRISYVNQKWILSFKIAHESQVWETSDVPMGIDLGIKELAVVSYGDQKYVFHNINKSKKMRTLEHKLSHINRVIQRKYRTNDSYDKTNAILKYEQIARDINYRICNIRKNYIHQITHQLIDLHPSIIVMENLKVGNMTKNKYLRKDIEIANFYEFVRQIQYKCQWNSLKFLKADAWFPSSKLCSRCGNKKLDLKLSDRVYNCTECGLKIDRDYNAAINLMKYVPQNKRVTA